MRVPGPREVCGALMTWERWATKKQGGSTTNGRDSAAKRLGVKKFAGEVSVSPEPSSRITLSGHVFRVYVYGTLLVQQ